MTWYVTLEDRQQKERKRRKPYKWGAKPFLSEFNVGDIKVVKDDTLDWHSLRTMAARMRRDYGCLFLFHNEERIIVRVK